MLMVKTRLGPSSIAGIGLFADEDIPAGRVTWRFVPGFDQLFCEQDIAGPTRACPQRTAQLHLQAPGNGPVRLLPGQCAVYEPRR